MNNCNCHIKTELDVLYLCVCLHDEISLVWFGYVHRVQVGFSERGHEAVTGHERTQSSRICHSALVLRSTLGGGG